MTTRNILIPLFLVLIFWGEAQAIPSAPLPRTIIALYDGKENPDIRYSRIHRFAAMPLNHLGLKLKFIDIHKSMPPIEDLQDIRGVITWFETDRMLHPLKFLSWAEQVMDRGIRWVVLGNLGVNANLNGKPTPLPMINRYLARLGLQTQGNWKQITYDVKLTHQNAQMVEFERPYTGILPPFLQTYRADKNNKTFLTASWGKDRISKSDLIVIGPDGGYAAPGYSMFEREDFNQWYLNPFEFFRQVFRTDDLPKPDVTTLSGRRVYYSHIDGDGWRNITEIEKYRKTKEFSAEVIFNEVLKPFPDLPVSLAPIAGDLDPQWYGSEEDLALARNMLALPHVEAGSHTYSHPYYWNYYRDYHPEKEWSEFLEKNVKTGLTIAKRYAPFITAKKSAAGQSVKHKPENENSLIPKIYDYPRAYLDYPFDLDREIRGSVEFINKLCPPGKKVAVLQWSGDTSPFPAAIEATRKINIVNINGGDSRFDAEFPSHAWVSPVGIHNEGQLQIYTSASNENTYTELWEDRFFGFQNLPETLKNTESPRRLKPINIYYHLYSGQKTASLNALLKNLHFAQKEEIVPVSTSHYAKMAEGFYSTRLIALGEKIWRIKNRGALQTIRFDNADRLAVNMEKSQGVIGQRHHQGSLYVSLDATKREPTLALKEVASASQPPTASRSYLVQGRWRVWNLELSNQHQLTFTAQGFGDGEMVWKVRQPGSYKLDLSNDQGTHQTLNEVAGEDGLLKFKFGSHAIDPVQITLTRVQPAL
jgi:polysaccharide biosynthesis protein PelA